MRRHVTKEVAATIAAAFARRCYDFGAAKRLSWNIVFNELNKLSKLPSDLLIRMNNSSTVLARVGVVMPFVLIAPDLSGVIIDYGCMRMLSFSRGLFDLLAGEKTDTGWYHIISITPEFIRDLANKVWEFIMSYDCPIK